MSTQTDISQALDSVVAEIEAVKTLLGTSFEFYDASQESAFGCPRCGSLDTDVAFGKSCQHFFCTDPDCSCECKSDASQRVGMINMPWRHMRRYHPLAFSTVGNVVRPTPFLLPLPTALLDGADAAPIASNSGDGVGSGDGSRSLVTVVPVAFAGVSLHADLSRTEHVARRHNAAVLAALYAAEEPAVAANERCARDFAAAAAATDAAAAAVDGDHRKAIDKWTTYAASVREQALALAAETTALGSVTDEDGKPTGRAALLTLQRRVGASKSSTKVNMGRRLVFGPNTRPVDPRDQLAPVPHGTLELADDINLRNARAAAVGELNGLAEMHALTPEDASAIASSAFPSVHGAWMDVVDLDRRLTAVGAGATAGAAIGAAVGAAVGAESATARTTVSVAAAADKASKRLAERLTAHASRSLVALKAVGAGAGASGAAAGVDASASAASAGVVAAAATPAKGPECFDASQLASRSLTDGMTFMAALMAPRQLWGQRLPQLRSGGAFALAAGRGSSAATAAAAGTGAAASARSAADLEKIGRETAISAVATLGSMAPVLAAAAIAAHSHLQDEAAETVDDSDTAQGDAANAGAGAAVGEARVDPVRALDLQFVVAAALDALLAQAPGTGVGADAGTGAGADAAHVAAPAAPAAAAADGLEGSLLMRLMAHARSEATARADAALAAARAMADKERERRAACVSTRITTTLAGLFARSGALAAGQSFEAADAEAGAAAAAAVSSGSAAEPAAAGTGTSGGAGEDASAASAGVDAYGAGFTSSMDAARAGSANALWRYVTFFTEARQLFPEAGAGSLLAAERRKRARIEREVAASKQVRRWHSLTLFFPALSTMFDSHLLSSLHHAQSLAKLQAEAAQAEELHRQLRSISGDDYKNDVK
jgi:hypothetical protein